MEYNDLHGRVIVAARIVESHEQAGLLERYIMLNSPSLLVRLDDGSEAVLRVVKEGLGVETLSDVVDEVLLSVMPELGGSMSVGHDAITKLRDAALRLKERP